VISYSRLTIAVPPSFGGITTHHSRLTNSVGEKIIKVVLSFTIPDCLICPLVALVLLYRRINYGYPFRLIPLTQGKYAIVDPEDYKRLSKYKWYAKKCGKTFYASRTVWTGKNKKRINITMHRQILNPPYPLVVDHINHNGLDNRKANLRPATRKQNNMNRLCIKRKGSPSKYKGVIWHKHTKKWNVQICYNGKRKTIGYFNDEIEAAKAYDEAAKKYHRDFAVLNFES